MSLLFADGFDHYDTNLMDQKWDNVGPHNMHMTAGRLGGGCYQLSNVDHIIGKYLPDSGTLICGTAVNVREGLTFRYINSEPIDLGVFRFEHNSVCLCEVKVLSNNKVAVYAGDGVPASGIFTIVGTSVSAIRSGCYVYIEAKITFHPTAGSAVIRVQEQEVLNLTGLDTGGDYRAVGEIKYYSANSVWPGVSPYRNGYMRLSAYDHPPWFDDFYICDDLGYEMNDFLGDVSVREELPISDGYYKEFLRSAGDDNFALVDDPAAAVDTTSYVFEKTVGKKDTYNFPQLSDQGDILAVVLNYYATKTSSGTRKIKALAREYGVDANGSEINIMTGYIYYQSILMTDVNGNPWTVDSVNNTEFGQEITE